MDYNRQAEYSLGYSTGWVLEASDNEWERKQARSAALDPTNDRLDSWKEIAAYLKKEVRTVQRWEKSSGLPVRRLAHGKQGTVFAYKSELDAWWQESQSKLADEEEKSDADAGSSSSNAIESAPAVDLPDRTDDQARHDRLRRLLLLALVVSLGAAIPIGIFWSKIQTWYCLLYPK